MYDTLRRVLIKDEGIRYLPYRDHLGNWTVGIGHNMQVPLSREAVDQIFKDDLKEVKMAETKVWWPFLNDARKVVVGSMIFNLGWPRFQRFKRFQAALEAGNWEKAADEMMYKDPSTSKELSTWAKQLGDGPGGKFDRVERLCLMMRTGEIGDHYG